jgi:lysozyme
VTTPYLLNDLRRDEGCRLTAYRDSGGVWTIGYGHTGPEVHANLTWTQAEAESHLAIDAGSAQRGLDTAIPWWRQLDDVRQDVLAEMAFNLGVEGLMGFTRMLKALGDDDYPAASAAMLLSKWANQVGDRATRLAAMMRTGVRPVS